MTSSHFKSQVAHWIRHPLARNAVSLYAVLFAESLLPLLTFPYLARVLGPASWGVIIYAQTFAAWLGLLLEYGFGLSATRRLARIRGEDPVAVAQERAEVVADVVGASSILALLALLFTALCAFTVPLFRQHPETLALGTSIALAQGLRPFWYFQGLERLGSISALNLIGRLITTGGVFILVHSPDDAIVVLWLQLVVTTLSLFWSTALVYRELPFVAPTWSSACRGLREGWSLFITRTAITLYTVANTFILGWFVPPALVTMFAGPERLSRSAFAVLTPLLSALYPRMANLAAANPERAAWAARRAFVVVAGSGVALGSVLALFAPLFIKILGPGYEVAIPVFRILALLAPLIAINSMLGAQWMVPLGLDRQLNRVIVTAAVIDVVLAIVLARTYGPIGMAICAVLAEVIVLVGLFFTLRLSGRTFWAAPCETN